MAPSPSPTPFLSNWHPKLISFSSHPPPTSRTPPLVLLVLSAAVSFPGSLTFLDPATEKTALGGNLSVPRERNAGAAGKKEEERSVGAKVGWVLGSGGEGDFWLLVWTCKLEFTSTGKGRVSPMRHFTALGEKFLDNLVIDASRKFLSPLPGPPVESNLE